MDISESTWPSEGWNHQQLLHLNSFNHKFWIICFSNRMFHYVLLFWGFFVNLNVMKHVQICVSVNVCVFLLATYLFAKYLFYLQSEDIFGKWGHFGEVR